MNNSCENCLFYVDVMPDGIICIGGKRTKKISQIKTNCEIWVENTPENAINILDELEKVDLI